MQRLLLTTSAILGLTALASAGEPSVPALATTAVPAGPLALQTADDGLFSVRWSDSPWRGKLVDPITAPYWFESPLHHTSVRPVLIRHSFPNDSIFGGGELDVIAVQARLAVTPRFSIIATKDGYYDLNPDVTALEGDGWADLAGGAKYAVIDDPDAGYLLTAGLIFELTQGSTEVFHGNGDGVVRPFVSGAWDRGDVDLLYALGLNYPLDDDAESTSFDFHLNATWAATETLRPMVEFNGIRYVSNGSALPVNFEGVDVVNLGANDVAGNTVVSGAIGARWLASDNVSVGLAYETAITSREDIFDNRIMLDVIVKW